jgi:hypothetical protein
MIDGKPACPADTPPEVTLVFNEWLGGGAVGDVYGDATGALVAKIVRPWGEETTDAFRVRVSALVWELDFLASLGNKVACVPRYLSSFIRRSPAGPVVFLLSERVRGTALMSWDLARQCVLLVHAFLSPMLTQRRSGAGTGPHASTLSTSCTRPASTMATCDRPT